MGLLGKAAVVSHHRDKKEEKKEAKEQADKEQQKKTWIRRRPVGPMLSTGSASFFQDLRSYFGLYFLGSLRIGPGSAGLSLGGYLNFLALSRVVGQQWPPRKLNIMNYHVSWREKRILLTKYVNLSLSPNTSSPFTLSMSMSFGVLRNSNGFFLWHS